MRKTTAVAAAVAFAAATVAGQFGGPARAQSVGGEPALPPKYQCAVKVSYPQGRPDLVEIEFPGGDCEDEDIALAVALAAILKSTVAKPRCLDQNQLAQIPCCDGGAKR
jgi:hypothetical protein